MRFLLSVLCLFPTFAWANPVTVYHAPTSLSSHGFSALTQNEEHSLFMISERERIVLQVTPTNPESLLIQDRYMVKGIDATFDTESMAALPHEQFLMGTELQTTQHKAETLFLTQLQNKTLTVIETIQVPHALWPEVHAIKNHGIEGLCATQHYWVAALEQSYIDATTHKRWAPVAVYNIDNKKFTAFRVELSTQTGLISALSCAETAQGIHVFALDRHYEESHLIAFDVLPAASDVPLLSSHVVLDLTQETHLPQVPNYEGLVAEQNDTFFILNDNHTRVVTGPTQIRRFIIDPQPQKPEHAP